MQKGYLHISVSSLSVSESRNNNDNNKHCRAPLNSGNFTHGNWAMLWCVFVTILNQKRRVFQEEVKFTFLFFLLLLYCLLNAFYCCTTYFKGFCYFVTREEASSALWHLIFILQPFCYLFQRKVWPIYAIFLCNQL